MDSPCSILDESKGEVLDQGSSGCSRWRLVPYSWSCRRTCPTLHRDSCQTFAIWKVETLVYYSQSCVDRLYNEDASGVKAGVAFVGSGVASVVFDNDGDDIPVC
jgi:hypothetical protein